MIKKCDLYHEGHIVNGSSISTHAKTESDLTDDEKKQLAILLGRWVVQV